MQDLDDDLEHRWSSWKKITIDTTLKILGPTRGLWISEDSWKLIDERDGLKIQREQEHTPGIASGNYRPKDKQVKKAADKTNDCI